MTPYLSSPLDSFSNHDYHADNFCLTSLQSQGTNIFNIRLFNLAARVGFKTTKMSHCPQHQPSKKPRLANTPPSAKSTMQIILQAAACNSRSLHKNIKALINDNILKKCHACILRGVIRSKAGAPCRFLSTQKSHILCSRQMH